MAVYVGVGNRSSIYIGTQVSPLPYVGAGSLFPINVKWDAATAQTSITVSGDGYRSHSTAYNVFAGVLATMAMPSTGKWWIEYISDPITDTVCNQGVGLFSDSSDWYDLTTGACVFMTNGPQTLYVANKSDPAVIQAEMYGGIHWASGVNIVGIGYDADAGTMICKLNNRALLGPYDISGLDLPIFPAFWRGADGGAGWTINGGRLAWTYAPPAGYEALDA